MSTMNRLMKQALLVDSYSSVNTWEIFLKHMNKDHLACLNMTRMTILQEDEAASLGVVATS